MVGCVVCWMVYVSLVLVNVEVFKNGVEGVFNSGHSLFKGVDVELLFLLSWLDGC